MDNIGISKLDCQEKIDHINDLHRKGIITYQQKCAIKNGVYRWFFDDFNQQVK